MPKKSYLPDELKKSERIIFRTTKARKEEIISLVNASGLDISDLIRKVLDDVLVGTSMKRTFIPTKEK